MKNDKRLDVRSLAIFILLSFTWSWLFWGIIIVIVDAGILLPSSEGMYLLLSSLASFGPFFGATVVTLLNHGKEDLILLLKKGININFKKIWIVVTILLFPSIYLIAIFLATITGVKTYPLSLNPDIGLFISTILIGLFGGPLGEEFGWRGFLLEKLQKKYNAIISSLIVAIVWAFWHIPIFLMPWNQMSPFWYYIIFISFISIIFTVMYNITNNSVLTAIILHLMLNFSYFFFGTILGIPIYSLFFLDFYVLLILILLAVPTCYYLLKKKQLKE